MNIRARPHAAGLSKFMTRLLTVCAQTMDLMSVKMVREHCPDPNPTLTQPNPAVALLLRTDRPADAADFAADHLALAL